MAAEIRYTINQFYDVVDEDGEVLSSACTRVSAEKIARFYDKHGRYFVVDRMAEVIDDNNDDNPYGIGAY